MTDATLASIITDAGTVATFVFSLVTQVINLITSNPILELFLCIGLAGIAVRFGFRILHKTKKLAN